MRHLQPILFIVALLSAAPPASATTVSEYTRHCRSLLVTAGDDYSQEEEIEEFWERHDRFAIIEKGGRFILVTRDAAMNHALQDDLRRWTESRGETVLPHRTLMKHSPVEDSVAYDVDNLMPAVARRFHWCFGRVNGWSTAAYMAGLTDGLFRMEANEFKLWLASPLARPLGENEDLQAGDVITYRSDMDTGASPSGEIHAAIYISDNLVFSKNGAAEQPLRVQDSLEVAAQYMNTRLMQRISSRIEAFRVRPFSAFVAEYGAALTAESAALLADLRRYDELTVGQNVDERIDTESDEYQARWRAEMTELRNLRKDLRRRAKAALEALGPTPAEGAAFEPNRFLWTIASLRTAGA